MRGPRSAVALPFALTLAFALAPSAEGKPRCPKGVQWDSRTQSCACREPLVWSAAQQACIHDPCPTEAPFDPETGACACLDTSRRWNPKLAQCESCPAGQAWEGSACVDRVYPFEAANYWSGEMQIIRKASDPRACALACDQDPNCKVATFADSTAESRWANTCILRPAVGNRHTGQVGMRSWVK
jgi:hypothetical protein